MEVNFDEGKDLLKEILLSEKPPILYLGAGFSIGAVNKASAMDGTSLKKSIFDSLVKSQIPDEDVEEVENYDLRKICDEAYRVNGGKEKLTEYLRDLYINTKPEAFHLNLVKYPWKDIYTVNIDDLVENIYKCTGNSIKVQNKQKLLINSNGTQLYKLHGCVNNSDEYFVFSEEDYRELTARKLDAKLNKFTNDLQKDNVIFIGASMDEPDIHHYLKVYEDAGCKYRNNKLIFIDYKPKRYLKNIVARLGATLIKGSNKDFLEFLGEINYQPGEIEKARIELSYNGIHLLSNVSKLYKDPYESKLYEGYFCQWQDVYDEWVFSDSNLLNAINDLENLLTENSEVKCFSLYGRYYSGKSCIIKQLAYHMNRKGYDVLEYRGRYLDIASVIKYIEVSANKKFVLVIDNASYYYEQIEKLFSRSLDSKELVILTSSRTYYHQKKKYYLEGNAYTDFCVESNTCGDNAIDIRNKLEEKTRLSYMVSWGKQEQIKEISKQHSVANLIVSLTYGNAKKRIDEGVKHAIKNLTDDEKGLLLELAIFDVLNIESYPRELFTERYGRRVNLDDNLSKDVMKIVDFVRMDEDGISLKNTLVENVILKENKSKIADCIISILKYVSRNVSEKRNDAWYIIFQCLLKEDLLESSLRLKKGEIERTYLSVKKEYDSISYYWLQLGLFMQRNGDFVSAYNYLAKSASIRPNSYKIQHAIARNYLRQANSTSNYEDAKELFMQGESKMKSLIDSKEYSKEKAKPFSVNSYVLEKIRFIRKHGLTPTNSELNYMNSIIESISQMDSYKEKVHYAFYTLLEEQGKLNIISIDFKSPYFKYVSRKNVISESDLEYDEMVEDV